MKTFFISLILYLLLYQANAQKVGLLTVAQLNQRFSQGRDTVYVVNFWATWCSPCVKELPHFELLNKRFSNQPLKVILVSLDFKSKLESDLKPFVKRLKITNEVFLINEKDQQSFIDQIDKSWSGAIPATLIVNTAKNRRQFIPDELSYHELLSVYKLNQ